jgi:hypothetical protein
MGAAWVAGSTRARLLARHRLGRDGARDVAGSGSFAVASERLTASPYGPALADTASLDRARREIWASALWDLRILAGWLQPSGVDAMRVFAAWFEIENIERLLLARDETRGGTAAYDLGALATVWPRVQTAPSPADVRAACANSAWHDPGSSDASDVIVHLRLRWARRLAEIHDATVPWGAGMTALVCAGLLIEQDGALRADVARRADVLPRPALTAPDVETFVALLPDVARWPFAAATSVDRLWRGEARWWARLDHDGERLLHAARPSLAVVVGAAAVRLADAWRTAAVLDIANRGGPNQELVDAVT